MDADLYDEFGNYVGPELESDEEENEDGSVEDTGEDTPTHEVRRM
jgi:U5 small nuclear ribonucleoprotein component